MKDQMTADRRMTVGCVGVHAVEEKNKADPELVLTRERGYSGKYRDDLAGQVLRDDLVIEARRKEMTYFNSKGFGTNGPSWRRGM